MEAVRPTKLGVALRVAAFAFLEIVGLMVFAPAFYAMGGYLVSGALGTFAAAAVANALAVRIWERGSLADIGLHWNDASRKNLLWGLVAGIGAACLVLAPPLITGFATLRPTPENPAKLGSAMFLSVVLLFGAIGEEMLFRGYGFQVLCGLVGPFATVLPTAILFSAAHARNENMSTLGMVNTFLWGVVLGYAFLRSGDLWLPIGLHFGWNWTAPLAGVNLSGFTMGVTGVAFEWKAGELWSGGAYGPEAGILCSAVCVVLIVFLRRAPIMSQEPFLMVRHEDRKAMEGSA